MSDTNPDDDVTVAPDVPPTPDEFLRTKAARSVKREHDLARLGAINALDDPDEETK